VKEFEAAAFAADPACRRALSRPRTVPRDQGVRENTPGTRSFEEVKPKLLAEQREQVQRDAFEGLISDLRKQATVRVLYKPEGPPSSPPGEVIPCRGF